MAEKKKVILITGACGFVGSNLYNRLSQDDNYVVMGCDNMAFGYIKNIGMDEIEDMKNLKASFLFDDFDKFPQNILDQTDILLHLGTSNIIYAMTEPVKVFEVNAYKTIKLFEKFKGKIIYTSTTSVYGQADIIPTSETAEPKLSNAYDQSKLIAEHFLRQRGNYTTLRLSNVYGPNQRPESAYCGVVGRLVAQALKGESLTVIGDGTQTRDYTFVDDVVNAVLLAIEQDAKNTEINIASGKEATILNLVDLISMEESIPKFGVNKGVVKRSIDKINRRCLLIEKAKYELGWSPKTSLTEGLRKTISWQLKEYHGK